MIHSDLNYIPNLDLLLSLLVDQTSLTACFNFGELIFPFLLKLIHNMFL